VIAASSPKAHSFRSSTYKGVDAEVVRAKRTEFSLISTKKPFVFFEKNMGR